MPSQKLFKLQILAPLSVLGAMLSGFSVETEETLPRVVKVRDVDCEVITHPDGSSELILGDDVPGSMSVVTVEPDGSLTNQCLMEGHPLDDFMSKQPQNTAIHTDR